MINSRSGDVPAYARLAARIRDDITTGRLRPGQAIPSERRLEQEFELGRHTIRKAVALLRAEGLVSVERGLGVVVREHNGEMRELTPAPGSTVTARMPSADERLTLDVDEGVPVISVEAPDGAVSAYPADRWKLRWPD